MVWTQPYQYQDLGSIPGRGTKILLVCNINIHFFGEHSLMEFLLRSSLVYVQTTDLIDAQQYDWENQGIATEQSIL